MFTSRDRLSARVVMLILAEVTERQVPVILQDLGTILLVTCVAKSILSTYYAHLRRGCRADVPCAQKSAGGFISCIFNGEVT